MPVLARLAAGALAASALVALTHAAETKLTLRGRVVDSSSRPVAGARVYVYTAAPRVGVGSACPSCYPECGKTTTTDKQGRFEFPAMSERLLYRLLFVADGRVPEFREHVDPRAGRLDQVLRACDSVLAQGLRTTVGHVVDGHGDPVPGASVLTRGVWTKHPEGDGVAFGEFKNSRVDAGSITSDEQGRFTFSNVPSKRLRVLGGSSDRWGRGRCAPSCVPWVRPTASPRCHRSRWSTDTGSRDASRSVTATRCQPERS